jgi:general secretion pathway protein A
MYYSYYGLTENPFKIAPDHRFLYLSETHREALAALVYGLEEGHSFLLLTGEVGTGKTIVLDSFRINIANDIKVIAIANPKISGEDFFYILSRRFNPEGSRLSKAQILEHLEIISNEKAADAHHTLLIIDEAQTLSHDLIEEIRLLSNMPPSVLQVFLVGQPELQELLAQKQFRSLDQRIGIRCDLRPMDRRETEDYIQHRLKVAGCKNYRSIFRQDALDVIYAYSRGIPRVINKLCDQVLITGFAENVRQIPEHIVKKTIRELATDAANPNKEAKKNIFYRLLFTEIKLFSIIVRIILFFVIMLLAAILVMDLMPDKTKPLSLKHNTTVPLAEHRTSQNVEPVRQLIEIGEKPPSTVLTDVTEQPIKEKTISNQPVTSVTSGITPAESVKNKPEQPVPTAAISDKKASPVLQLIPEAPPSHMTEQPIKEKTISNQPVTSVTSGITHEASVKNKPEQPLDTTLAMPGRKAALVQQTLPKEPPSQMSLSHPAVPETSIISVKQGDSLSRLIQTYYGEFNATIFRRVTEFNPHIKNPDTIHPGEKINFPKISGATNSDQ